MAAGPVPFSRRRACRLSSLAGIAFAMLAPLASLAEPASHKPLAPLAPWIPLVDDPATADSAYAGVLTVMPSLADSFPRSFAWYLLYSAAQAKGRVDAMQAAAESSFALQPSDPSALREFGTWLGRRHERLELAEGLLRRTVEIVEHDSTKGSLVGDLAWLGEIQSRRGHDDAAVVTWERCADEAKGSYPYVLFELSDAYARRGDVARAIRQLVAGLSVFTPDTSNTAEARGKLDSLAGVHGWSRDSLHAEIAAARSRSHREFYLERYRTDRPAPRQAMTELETGRRVVPVPARGITVAYCWATWCGPCRHALPVLQEWAKQPRTTPVRVITVNIEGEPPAEASRLARSFVDEHRLALPVFVADSTAAVRWGVQSFPTTFVIRDSRIVYRGHAGELVEGLDAQLESLGSRRAAASGRKPRHD